MKVIARMRSDFPAKFGIPRQSGLVSELEGTVVFEPPYRDPAALRGLDGYSHIWLIWGFSEAMRAEYSPTVRPPRLGGNRRVGVFATRSPYRPNPIGLSCVRLEAVEQHPEHGPILRVRGADLMDGTPIYDVKPYLPYTDSHPEAVGGFADDCADYALSVDCPEQWLAMLPEGKREPLLCVLAQDPRPSYQHDPARVYGMAFAGFDVKFTVENNTLTVVNVVPLMAEGEDAPR